MTVDEIYLNIGQSISNAIDDSNWTTAKLNIEVIGDGVVGYTGDYQVNGGTIDLSVRKISREIRNWIRELHKTTTDGGHNKWNKAVFTLTPDGKFDMEFTWDQTLQDQIEKLS